MPKLSVIVPVYNAENAIERCIESILNQEFRDLELILIDDGSGDGSPAILDRAAENDARVRVIHKQNSGVSDTRNNGIDLAEGTFIQFVDADDWVTADSGKMLVRTAEEMNADLVVAEFYRVVGENLSRKGSIETDRVLTRQEYAEFMKISPADYYYGVIWNKLYRRDILNRYGIRMDKDVSFCEDFIFNLEYVLHCNRIAPLQLPVYYYVRTEGSLVTQNLNFKRLINMKTSVYQYYDEFFRNVLDEEEYRMERPAIASFLVSAATDEFAPPFSFSTKKVGSENVQVRPGPYGGVAGDFEAVSRMYDTLLNTVALKNNLNLNDVKVFQGIRALKRADSLRELAAITGLSEPSVLASLQSLGVKRMIRLSFGPLAASIATDYGAGLLHDIDHAEKDYETMCFSELEPKEAEQFRTTLAKIAAAMHDRKG